ncbi:endonuclease domain-containing protein [Methylocystis sp. Sn-Cys]|uniref:endonuclease domain-containing protein n=1 Tax=Methylocystis sp. Sn-Cys TaxID=1701263 RepID=UPI001924D6A1|nr:endonuclease domain-containing protein [Methylocystis sp. Sn-Cys]MBL1258328.1 endonuclease domain-containing protein [Methylocystis sp. Sn-Cys]
MRGLRFIETRRSRELRRDATSAEKIMWGRLRNRNLGGFKFVRQEPIGPFIADFVCRECKLVVEIDGETHSNQEEIAADVRRSDYLNAQGYQVIRFRNQQVYENADAVAEAILAALSRDQG